MPEIKSMFPSKYLSFSDLEPNRLYEGTIKAVMLEQVNVRGFGGGGFANQQTDAEPSWLLYFHEFAKPIKMRRTRAEKIGVVLGSSNTDHWPGKRLRFYRGVWSNGGKSGEGLMIDDRPTPPSPAAAIAGGSSLVAASDRRPIPKAPMDRFINHLKGHGKTWDDYLHWCKVNVPEAYALAWGVDLASVPAGLLPAMKAYLDSLALPPAQEVIDRETGEITMKAPGPPAGEPIPDDDIPF